MSLFVDRYLARQIISYITHVLAHFETMIAAPIVAALMLVAVGGGALDEGIVGVPGRSPTSTRFQK